MSAIEYRNLLFKISQKIDWISERQRLLFITEGLFAEESETNIQDVLSLFKVLEERKNLGIDRLEVLKDILKEIGKWNLLEKVEKFEIKRKEFNSLLEYISRALDESGHLERLVSVCKGRIAQDRESSIKDVRTLFTELEKVNHLGVGRLDILKVLIGTDKPDLLKQVEEFENKRKQEEVVERKRNELEESKRRRNAQAVAVLSSARFAGERLIGTVTPYCTFRNVAGGIVVVTTWMILRRSTSLEEFVNAFTEAVLPAANTLRAISEGSLCFTIQAESNSALEELWIQFQDGTLRKNLQDFLVTDEIKQLVGGEEVTVTVDIDEQEYKNTCLDLMVTETQAQSEEGDRSRAKIRRNSDSLAYYPSRENDVSAVLSNLKQVTIKSLQEIIERQEKEIVKLKAKLEEGKRTTRETKALGQIPNGTSGEGDETRLKKRRNSDSVLYCQREVEDTRLSEGKVERVEQWERSAFIWRYLENLPETFSEPSEIADSGVSTQSSFSELDTKEVSAIYDRGRRLLERPANVIPRQDGINEEHLSSEKVLSNRRGVRDGEGEKAAYAENLGILFQSRGDYSKAIENHLRALTIRKEIGDREGEATAYGNLGNAYYSLGAYGKAMEYQQLALAIRREIGDRQGEATAYGNLGIVCYSLGDFREATKYQQMTLAIRQEIGDRQGEAAAYGNLGNALLSLGNYVKAQEYLERALLINIAAGDKEKESAVYANLGTVFHSVGQYEKAKECLEKALVIRTEIGDRQRVGAVCGKLATVLLSLGEYAKAKEYVERALEINVEIGDRQGEAICFGILGNVFESLGEFAKAIGYLKKALVIDVEIGDRQGEASCYGNLGNVYQSTGRFFIAKEYLQKALAINLEIEDKQGEASCYGNLGTVFHYLGEHFKAKEYLEKALVISKEIGDKQGEASFYADLGAVFKSVGDFEKAKEFLEKALVIRREIGDRQGEAVGYANLGTVFQIAGDYSKAKEFHKKALAIRREIADKRSWEVATYQT